MICISLMILCKFFFCLQDNVALIVVLEAKFSSQTADNPGKRQLLCVVRIANVILLHYLYGLL